MWHNLHLSVVNTHMDEERWLCQIHTVTSEGEQQNLGLRDNRNLPFQSRGLIHYKLIWVSIFSHTV